MSGWHFVHVYDDLDDGDERVIDVLHPDDCQLRLDLFGPVPGVLVERLCGISHEAEMVGQADSFGNPDPGWYAVRYWVDKSPIGGSAWTEITTGIEVVPLVEWAASPPPVIGEKGEG